MTDDLLKWRSEFPILDKTVYLISHSLGAMPRATYDRLHEYADAWATRGVRAWAEGWWEMPVTIGVFVMHGRVKAANGEQALDRFNRSYEYDGLGDGYARFLLDELLPEVEKKTASDGRPSRERHDPNRSCPSGPTSTVSVAPSLRWETIWLPSATCSGTEPDPPGPVGRPNGR